MHDYERIARVIRHLERIHGEQPDLDQLARFAGLSSYHFHRLFSRWAGITPKDFIQCQTLADARDRLRQGESVLDAALQTGLSGPGRLHDLCVTLESATPGEMKTGGAGLMIRAGFAKSPFGWCLMGECSRGICHLSFVDSNRKVAWNDLLNRWPKADIQRSDRAASKLAKRIYARPQSWSQLPGLRAFVRGTPFQIKVWRALLAVPPGSLVSYGKLADAVDCSGGARAVGSAVGKNSLAYLIPCHRVIRETGVLGNYRWGTDRKRLILSWESVTGR